jgi:hypothetical protein
MLGEPPCRWIRAFVDTHDWLCDDTAGWQMSDGPSRISKIFGSRRLKGIPDIRTFFRTTEQSVFFVGATTFNLLGIDR